MSSKKDYIKQVANVKIVTITKPRVYVKWENTEAGRDVAQCYERENDVYVRYVNTFNRNISVIKGDPFFDTLEELYNTAYANSKLK